MKNSSVTPRPPAQSDIWILAGQSNMEGCGDLREASKPDHRVWSFSTQHRWAIARDPLHDLIESSAPVDWHLRCSFTPPEIVIKGEKAIRHYWRVRNRQTRGGAGLGISFGTTYANATGRPVGLISSAHGGTSLEQWNPNRKKEGLSSLYGAMLERVRLAGGNLRGILWYQGESDATPEASATYAKRFVHWVKAVRRDTGHAGLPIITAQIGCTSHVGWDAKAWSQVRQIQYELPLQVSKLAVAASVDLGLHDTIHIDAHGLKRLGKRMARLALGLTGEKGMPKNSPRLRKIGGEAHGIDMAELHINFAGVDGGWHPERQITGFSLLDANGDLHAQNCVTTAFRHPKHPSSIIVRLHRPPSPGDQLAYGKGTFPVCNAVDSADMALPAFQIKINLLTH